MAKSYTESARGSESCQGVESLEDIEDKRDESSAVFLLKFLSRRLVVETPGVGQDQMTDTEWVRQGVGGDQVTPETVTDIPCSLNL